MEAEGLVQVLWRKGFNSVLAKAGACEEEGRFYFDDDRPESIGRVKPFLW
ncbi:hypothetical protein ACEQPO_18895 [Bacillus sp. SL00103]